MPSRHVIIRVHNGVHARPVAELARLALAHPAPVTLRAANGTTVAVSSVLAVMDLGLAEGEEVVLDTQPSADADQVLEAMARVLDPLA
ncbi:phosphotransferase [Microbacterium sp. CH12i]|uniref:HPr family phosphocarrier protein n=1 Tax=Microbacterium sp. CH12i TaxID=1479651 RepID=UPI00046191E8|nr:HPr family phosphocarrier protein [Microbacterium sp. CH12i]KDA06055.1 phosphotransferase [Microbacterium sp. CH12i]